MKKGKYYKGKGLYQGKIERMHYYKTDKGMYSEEVIDLELLINFSKEHPFMLLSVVLSVIALLMSFLALFV